MKISLSNLCLETAWKFSVPSAAHVRLKSINKSTHGRLIKMDTPPYILRISLYPCLHRLPSIRISKHGAKPLGSRPACLAVRASSNAPPPLQEAGAITVIPTEVSTASDPNPQPPPNSSELTSDRAFSEELGFLLALLPERIRMRLEVLTADEDGGKALEDLVEIVLDLGRKPLARFPSGDVNIAEEVVMAVDLEYAVSQVGEFGGDNRAGIDRTLHRISAIRNRAGKIVGLTCRVGRAISGSAEMVRDLVAMGDSLLLMGPPGVGKTTAIREVARLLAADYNKRVVIVDTSNEIGGDGDIPHKGIGRARRMQVPQVEMQHEIMIEAVENHMPQSIVIDEIGTELEALAAGTIAQRGVQLVGTAHGMTVDNLIKNPSLQNLVGGIQSVTLGDEEARRRGVQKSVLERKGPPVFASAVEMASRREWRVHRSLAATVDALLAGRTPLVEVRRMSEDGQLMSRKPRDVPSSKKEQEGEFSYYSDGPETDDDEDSDAFFSRTEAAGQGAEGSWEGQDWSRPNGPLMLYTFQIAEAPLEQVMEVMGLEGSVQLTENIGAADAVLALRSKLKHNTWVRGMAKYRQLPIFAIKSNTMAQMVRAMRAILGMNPFSSSLGPSEALSSGGRGRLEDEGGSAAKWMAVGNRASLEDELDALEEARSAVEEIVIPKNQPVELLPRSMAVIELQVDLVEGYQLKMERVGMEPNCRLRILPRTYGSPTRTSGGQDAWGKMASGTLEAGKGILDRDVQDDKLGDDAIENYAGSGLSVSRLPVLEDP